MEIEITIKMKVDSDSVSTPREWYAFDVTDDHTIFASSPLPQSLADAVHEQVAKTFGNVTTKLTNCEGKVIRNLHSEPTDTNQRW